MINGMVWIIIAVFAMTFLIWTAWSTFASIIKLVEAIHDQSESEIFSREYISSTFLTALYGIATSIALSILAMSLAVLSSYHPKLAIIFGFWFAFGYLLQLVTFLITREYDPADVVWGPLRASGPRQWRFLFGKRRED